MSTLSNYATASASNKEDRIYKVFAYLNTRGEFQPIELKKLSSVSDDTIYGYLKTIQNAQMANEHYRNHLEAPILDWNEILFTKVLSEFT